MNVILLRPTFGIKVASPSYQSDPIAVATGDLDFGFEL